jgi:hypothetical protein
MSKESEVCTEAQHVAAPAPKAKIDLDAQYKPIGIQAVSCAAEIKMHKASHPEQHR